MREPDTNVHVSVDESNTNILVSVASSDEAYEQLRTELD